MVVVKAAKLPSKKTAKRDLYATVCYYYPQYNLQQAQNLPGRDINLLIKTAQKMEAVKMYNLTQIVAAPNSHKGRSVKKLLDHFKKVAGF